METKDETGRESVGKGRNYEAHETEDSRTGVHFPLIAKSRKRFT